MIALEASTLNSLFGIHPYVHHTHSCLRLVFDTNTRSRVRVKKYSTRKSPHNAPHFPLFELLFSRPFLHLTLHSMRCPARILQRRLPQAAHVIPRLRAHAVAAASQVSDFFGRSSFLCTQQLLCTP